MAKAGYHEGLVPTYLKGWGWCEEVIARAAVLSGLIVMVAPLTFQGRPTGVSVSFGIALTQGPSGLRFSYSARESGDWRVTRVTLLEGAFTATDADNGYLVLPRGTLCIWRGERGCELRTGPL